MKTRRTVPIVDERSALPVYGAPTPHRSLFSPIIPSLASHNVHNAAMRIVVFTPPLYRDLR
jgi:hypothetical protein